MAKKKKKMNTAAKKTTSAGPVTKPRTKTQIFGAIADETGLSKKDVSVVFDAMESLIKRDIGGRGPGTFTVPGLMKIRRIHKPKRPARKGINPFTGEETMFKAKPAHNVVKVTALKKLKDMV